MSSESLSARRFPLILRAISHRPPHSHPFHPSRFGNKADSTNKKRPLYLLIEVKRLNFYAYEAAWRAEQLRIVKLMPEVERAALVAVQVMDITSTRPGTSQCGACRSRR